MPTAPRAVEVTIVNDQGDVIRWTGHSADILAHILAALAETAMDAGEPLPTPEETRPFRRVTEAEGHVEDTYGDEPYIAGPGKNTMLVDMLPYETRKDCTPYRFRFTCEAVRVPDQEKRGT